MDKKARTLQLILLRLFGVDPFALRQLRSHLSDAEPIGAVPTAVAELVGVCDDADFNQLVREREARHADEGAGWTMVAHILFE